MEMDTTENGFKVESATDGIVVTEAMGLTPGAPSLNNKGRTGEADVLMDCLDEQELKGIIESLLYISKEPLTVDKVTTVLAGPPKVVVNNAILIVHQTLFLVRNETIHVNEAIIEAVRNRIRPIFMSTLTSVIGMLPLVIFPGAGSELYRGLGSVVLGGLSLSAVLTLLIIPPLLSLVSAVVERGMISNNQETGQPAG